MHGTGKQKSGHPAREPVTNTVLLSSERHSINQDLRSQRVQIRALGCTKIYAGYVKKNQHKDLTETTGKTDLNDARNRRFSNPPQQSFY